MKAHAPEDAVVASTPPSPSGAFRTSRRALALDGKGAPPAAARGPVAEAVYRSAGANRWRFIRAYSTTFTVIGSYLWLRWCSRLLGRAYRENRIDAVHKRNARRVYDTIVALQGLFIKVGQLLSILANFLPSEFRAELEGLQDRVPPRPFSEIAPRVEGELGAPLGVLFKEFHHDPIASASLGQVHEAETFEGVHVAVKVQHADIDEIVRLDLGTIRRIVMIVQWFVPLKGLDAYYLQIKELLRQELDFKLEADNIERIAKNFEKNPRVRFPVPIRSHSTARVLTTSFVVGVRIGDAAAVEGLGVDRKDLASRLVRAYCQMIFVDGVYHADPHPGNVLVNAEGDLVLLDFGAVGELSQEMREGIPEFLEGVIRRDTDQVVKALRKMGFLSRTSDVGTSEKIIEYFHRRFQEEVKLESLNLKDIKIDPQRGFENLLDLRRMNVGLKDLAEAFHVPKDWVLLERTLLLVYGSCATLDPELEPMGIIQPYLQEFVLGNRDWREIAMETIRDMALSAVTLPEDMKKYLQKANRGEMELRVHGLQEGARTVYAIGRQLIYTAIAIASGFAAMSFHGRGEEAHARLLLGVTVVAASLLVMSSLLARPRR